MNDEAIIQQTRSPSIAALAAALAKAQAEIQPASKDKRSHHGAYADLASVWDACRGALTKNGLSILQPVSADGAKVTVTTLLAHSSGEWVSSDLTMTATKSDPQGLGSCITYARRYALAAMVGIAPAEDDGDAASANGRAAPVMVSAPAGYVDWIVSFSESANHGLVALRQTFKNASVEYRDYLTKHDNDRYELIKKRAGQVELPAEKVGA